MDNIEYSSVTDQIEKLLSQNLLIPDVAYAQKMLTLYGYSNLIKSYREPYTITCADGKKVFRAGVSFDQICSLYLLDKNLRNSVMAAMLDLEEHIKEAAADVVASSFGVQPDQYLQFRCYQNKRKHVERFSLGSILNAMRETLNTDKDPIHHYATVHGIVPPWILFKSVYFSTMVNFIDQFKRPQKEAMIKHLYVAENIPEEYAEAASLMMKTLMLSLSYRNRAAHGGRIYNYSGSRDDANYGFSQLLIYLNRLAYQSPFIQLNESLSEEINRHCSKYPEDVTYLSTVLNIDIKPVRLVYISENSHKYHADRHCSGMQNAKAVELDEIKDSGYTPCHRCFRSLS